MKELSLNILDIAENSVKAGAKLTEISIVESEEKLILTITDNGCGMKKEFLETVTNPFSTTRTTRKVGLGLPLLKLEAEQTGGNLTVTSKHISEYPDTHGTIVCAVFFKNHIDCIPLGDVVSSLTTLIQGHPEIDFSFNHSFDDKTVSLKTSELRSVLEDVPLNSYDVIKWIEEYLKEQYK